MIIEDCEETKGTIIEDGACQSCLIIIYRSDWIVANQNRPREMFLQISPADIDVSSLVIYSLSGDPLI